jgi:hypothetical protein
VLHRDVGYLAVALTLAYAISGLAVNHLAHWNPSYSITRTFVDVAPITAQSTPEIVAAAVERLGLASAPKNAFRPDPQTVQLFYAAKVYHVDLPTGKVMIESTVPRRVLYEMNLLHLNRPKRMWTYIADLYAVSLILLAVTGLFVLKGKLGITGRGAWLTAAGALVPVGYLLLS